MPEQQPIVYHDNPQPRLTGKTLTSWTGTDVFVLLVIVLLMILAWVYIHPLMFLGTGVLLLPLLIRPRWGYGRAYRDIAMSLWGAYLMKVLGGILWIAEDQPGWRIIKWLRRRGHAFWRPYYPIPFSLGRVQAEVEGKPKRFALLHQLDRPYDHFFIAGEGGAFASLDINQNHRAVEELATITNRVIAQTDLDVGISYLRITGPFDPTRIAEYVRYGTNPLIAQTDKFALDSDTAAWVNWMRENAGQLRPVARASGAAKNWFLIVMTVKRTHAWRVAQRNKATDEQLYELPIIELGTAMIEDLESSHQLKLGNVHCLELSELATVVRSSWDVTTINEYYEARAAGEIPTSDEEINRLVDEHGITYVDHLLRAFPQKEIRLVKDDPSIILDDNHLSAIRFTVLPRRSRVDQYLSLHHLARPGNWTRHAWVGQEVSGDAETRNIIYGASALANVESAFLKNRVVRNPKVEKKLKQLAEQSEQSSAHSIAQHFNGIITVVAGSQAELRENRKKILADMRSAGFDGEIVKPASVRLDAVLTGMFGGNRL